jgi:aconitate hydratase
MIPGNNSFNTLSTLDIDGREYFYYSLDKLAEQDLEAIRRLPFSLKILLENILRCERGGADTAGDIRAFADWLETRSSQREIAFRPARVLMQDFTGVPAVVDLAAMRDAAGDHPARINPRIPVDLVIDHSVMVDEFASAQAFDANVALDRCSIIFAWFPRVPVSVTRLTSSTWRRRSGSMKWTAAAMPFPIRWSAPIRIPP